MRSSLALAAATMLAFTPLGKPSAAAVFSKEAPLPLPTFTTMPSPQCTERMSLGALEIADRMLNTMYQIEDQMLRERPPLWQRHSESYLVNYDEISRAKASHAESMPEAHGLSVDDANQNLAIDTVGDVRRSMSTLALAHPKQHLQAFLDFQRTMAATINHNPQVFAEGQAADLSSAFWQLTEQYVGIAQAHCPPKSQQSSAKQQDDHSRAD